MGEVSGDRVLMCLWGLEGTLNHGEMEGWSMKGREEGWRRDGMWKGVGVWKRVEGRTRDGAWRFVEVCERDGDGQLLQDDMVAPEDLYIFHLDTMRAAIG